MLFYTPPDGHFNIYPAHPLAPGLIESGFAALARHLAAHERVVTDGIGGVMWTDFRARLGAALDQIHVAFDWLDCSEALRPEPEIEALLAPDLGGNDPLFGKLTGRLLRDFFVNERLAELRSRVQKGRRTLLYGTGAALVGTEGFLVYLDVPKNEIQFRSRAGSITNLGATRPADPKQMYKRFYFVDWPTLRRHQADLLPRVDLVVDGQRPETPTMMTGEALRRALAKTGSSWFRVRPWFEPGPWGGQWMKQRFPGLAPDAPNLAWSFELISPENGLAFESSGRRLEVAFDFLMFQEQRAVLGDFAERFGFQFPIRFDYLDTFGGGNLSLQCHPRPEYTWSHFGERFTQEETYYVTDCADGAGVFLGFQENIEPREFRQALELSGREACPLPVERFVQKHAARKHQLYLIPHGTIHCSGRDNLVLEISATPYIFTFKMYDWMRLDLDGRPRPLNIERAMANLSFTRKGDVVGRELIASPRRIAGGEGWELFHLPTHAAHFYDVHRFEFSTAVEVRTAGSPHVLNIVEGSSVWLETAQAAPKRFAFAETFVVPAAAGAYRLRSEGGQSVKVIQAFLKPEARTIPDYLL
jgi:mannose-6-phosphate isomerase class I